MNKDKYVFAQLVEFLDNNKFRHLVDKYDGNRYVKNFTCWNQLMALMFGQLCNRESLRDVVVALETHQSKCYHLGMGRNPIAKTTFATANQNRDYRIFEDFAFFMMEQARKKRATDIFKLKGNVYAFDSTTIPLCLSVFWWAKFRKKKGGVKAHVLYDLESQVSAFFHITTASVLVEISNFESGKMECIRQKCEVSVLLVIVKSHKSQPLRKLLLCVHIREFNNGIRKHILRQSTFPFRTLVL